MAAKFPDETRLPGGTTAQVKRETRGGEERGAGAHRYPKRAGPGAQRGGGIGRPGLDQALHGGPCRLLGFGCGPPSRHLPAPRSENPESGASPVASPRGMMCAGCASRRLDMERAGSGRPESSLPSPRGPGVREVSGVRSPARPVHPPPGTRRLAWSAPGRSVLPSLPACLRESWLERGFIFKTTSLGGQELTSTSAPVRLQDDGRSALCWARGVWCARRWTRGKTGARGWGQWGTASKLGGR